MRILARMLVTALLVSSAAFSQTAAVSTAREIAKQGLDAYDAGQYDEAAQKLTQAYAVVKVPTLALYTARALVKVNKLVEASEIYLQATRLAAAGSDQATQEQAQKDAAKERVQLLSRIPTLVIQIEGATPEDVSVTIDGTDVPQALWSSGQMVNPGAHAVVAKRGEQTVEQEANLAEGERKSVVLGFQVEEGLQNRSGEALSEPKPDVAEPPPRDSGPTSASSGSLHRTLGWVGLGVGGAGLVLGSVAGISAMSKRSQLQDDGCDGNSCYADQSSDVDSYNSTRTLSTVGFVVAAVGLGTGVTLLLTAPKHEEATTAQVAAYVGLGWAGLKGTF